MGEFPLAKVSLHPPLEGYLQPGAALAGTVDLRQSQDSAETQPNAPKCIAVAVTLETEERVEETWRQTRRPTTDTVRKVSTIYGLCVQMTCLPTTCGFRAQQCGHSACTGKLACAFHVSTLLDLCRLACKDGMPLIEPLPAPGCGGESAADARHDNDPLRLLRAAVVACDLRDAAHVAALGAALRLRGAAAARRRQVGAVRIRAAAAAEDHLAAAGPCARARRLELHHFASQHALLLPKPLVCVPRGKTEMVSSGWAHAAAGTPLWQVTCRSDRCRCGMMVD